MISLPPPEDVRWSGNKYEGNSGQVYLACLHESVGITDRFDLAAFCERAGVSYNAIADNDGIVYTVPRSDSAWHLRQANGRADGLCLTTPTRGYTREEWLGPQRNKVEIAAWWLEIVTRDRGIDLARCNHQNIADALRGNRAAGGVIGHMDYTFASHLWLGYQDGSHTDPRNFPFDVCIARAHEIRARGIEEDIVATLDDLRRVLREEQDNQAKMTWNWTMSGQPPYLFQDVAWVMQRETRDGIRKLLEAQGIDPAVIAQQVAELAAPALVEEVADAVTALSDEDLQRIATAVADEHARRAAA